jgi:hypothetical protein
LAGPASGNGDHENVPTFTAEKSAQDSAATAELVESSTNDAKDQAKKDKDHANNEMAEATATKNAISKESAASSKSKSLEKQREQQLAKEEMGTENLLELNEDLQNQASIQMYNEMSLLVNKNIGKCLQHELLVLLIYCTR